ncbi:MAG: thioesterase [Oribacterium sp.]|nr:thioesterase [Oribacterium sp.]
MYQCNSRVRYSETDERGNIRLTALVNYLQDCSTFHSMDAGLPISRLKEMHRTWLLSYWDIYIDRMPRLGEQILIGTSPYGFRGVLASRNFWIRTESGEDLLRADSVWFCFDTERRRPVKAPEEMILPFGVQENLLKLPVSSRKIDVPADLIAAEPVLIQPHHIDSNHHVNNAQYIEIADEALTSAVKGSKRFTSGRVRVEYRTAAVLGDTMIPLYGSTADGQGVIVSLQNPGGEVYCNVEFR